MAFSAIVIKGLFYGSALLTIGLTIHGVLRISERNRLLLYASISTLVLVTAKLLQLNANAGGGWSYAFSTDTFTWIWATNKNQTYVYVVGLLFIIIASAIKRRNVAHVISALGAIITALGFGLSGHTQGLANPGLMPALVIGHVIVAGFWFVAPITLYPRASVNLLELQRRVTRFSHFAVWLVPALFASGIWLLLTISGSLQTVITQNYGRLLLLKLLCAIALLALGAYNKLHVSRELQTNSGSARLKLRRTLKLEALLFTVVLMFIALATTVIGPEHGY